MKSIRDIVIIATVAIGLLVLVVFLFRPNKAASDAGNKPGDQPDGYPPSGPLPCQNIPGNLPPFQNAEPRPAPKPSWAYLTPIGHRILKPGCAAFSSPWMWNLPILR